MSKTAHSELAAQRLPKNDRFKIRETQFFQEYRDCYYRDTEEVYLAYADTVVLMKKVKEPTRTVDRTAERKTLPTGKFGGNRVVRATPHDQPQIQTAEPDSRPEENSRIAMPAIVDINPSRERREMFGLDDDDIGMVHFPKKWLDDRGIVIDTAEDFISYQDTRYRLQTLDKRGNFLNIYSDLTYAVGTL